MANKSETFIRGKVREMGATFGVDMAKRLVNRAEIHKLPVNKEELRMAREILKHHRTADQGCA